MRALFLLVIASWCPCAQAQRDSAVYRVRPWMDGALCAAGGVALYAGLHTQGTRTPLSARMVEGATWEHIPAFDRAALRIDPAGQQQALRMSNLGLFTTTAAPLALIGLDPRLRAQWGSVLTLYVETATIVGGLQSWTCMATGRYRPITYIGSATLEQRTDPQNTHSFFSGHTASTAAASFFMAKVLDDMHPEWRGKRWLLYGAAAIPPALVGYYRIEGGKHFPSDVLTGALVGAAAGILVPELHRTDGRLFQVMPIASANMLGVHAALSL